MLVILVVRVFIFGHDGPQFFKRREAIETFIITYSSSSVNHCSFLSFCKCERNF